MGAGHGHQLHFHGHSPVHRCPAHLKLLALRRLHARSSWPPRASWYWAFAVYAAAAGRRGRGVRRAADATSRSGWSSRCPFVVFAALMPFIATGPRVEVLGRQLSASPACSAPGALLAKGTLGVLASPRPGRDHRAARPARRPRAAAAAAPARADHGLHGPLPRRGHRRDAPDADRPRVPRLRGPRRPRTGRSSRARGRPVHPLLRARRAGAPRDALPRLRRPYAGDPARDATPAQWAQAGILPALPLPPWPWR